ncbi:conserved hypothetical protein [Mycobacterium marinum E11]|nr:conserved hypothetical protein [Mycobacterium marinum E11]
MNVSAVPRSCSVGFLETPVPTSDSSSTSGRTCSEPVSPCPGGVCAGRRGAARRQGPVDVPGISSPRAQGLRMTEPPENAFTPDAHGPPSQGTPGLWAHAMGPT